MYKPLAEADKSFIKAVCIITTFAIMAALVIGSIATYRGTNYLEAEIDEKIIATTEKYANDFSAEFNHMEGLTNSLASYVKTTFDVNAYKNSPEGYMGEFKEQLAEMIKNDLSNIKSAHSLYVTFNPELTQENDEVWYCVIDGEIKKIEADFENNKRLFSKPYADDMEYFFKPQEKNEGVWVSPYFDRDIEKEVFTYADAVYVDGLFVGVAGADINAEDMLKVIEEMSLYDGGWSALIDENSEFIVHNDGASKKEEQEIIEILKNREEQDGTGKSGSMSYVFAGAEKIMGYSKLQNGWTFITTQPSDAVYRPIRMLKTTMFILGIFLVISFMAFLIAFSKPILTKTSRLEEENRNKEIIIIYQSRQAKIGEMVGNITHQWKQPLNTINLILGNLLDSYRYGDLDEKRLEKSVTKVEGIVEKMSETITDFSGFLKPAKEKTLFDVRDCISSAVSLMEESITVNRIKLDVICNTERQAYGYGNEMTHVIFNLLNNARDAIVEADAEDRRITVEISEAVSGSGREGAAAVPAEKSGKKSAKDAHGCDMIKITVSNNGREIPEEVLEHIFEPYFTTRDDTGGTGLGLYISRQIVEDRMGGKLSVENAGGGVCCTVLIPERIPDDENDGENSEVR